MIKVLTNIDDSFIIELSERARKILKRAAKEWSLDEAQHLENLLTNLFENKILEYRRTDGPLMAEKYELLSEKDQAIIDKLLTPEPKDA